MCDANGRCCGSDKCCRGYACLVTLTISACLCMLVAIALTIVLFGGLSFRPDVPCLITRRLSVAHRGYTEDYQENTLEAVRAAVAMGFAPEFDVIETSDHYAVLSHDENLLRLTGLDQRAMDTSRAEFEELSIRTDIDASAGKVYNKTASFAFLDQVLQELCPQGAPFFVDLKLESQGLSPTDRDYAFASYVIELLQLYDCTRTPAEAGTPIILATYNPRLTGFMQEELDSRGLQVQLDFFMHPNTLPLGLDFMFRTRFLIWMSGVSLVGTHISAYSAHKRELDDLLVDGYCTAVYGGNTSVIGDVGATVTNADVPGTWIPGGDSSGALVYEKDTTPYDGFVGVLVVLWISFVVVLVIAIWYGIRVWADSFVKRRCYIDRYSEDVEFNRPPHWSYTEEV